ncbi:MAG: phosphatidylglycerol lysyltransferase domain-containing protein [Methanosarcinaceae archaeon]|nr:phosphatidylglycerol lysyltransferase domain-containing protein [Methanosarcinaceae archaeon]
MEKLTIEYYNEFKTRTAKIEHKLWSYYYPVHAADGDVYVEHLDDNLLFFKKNGHWDALLPPIGNVNKNSLEECFEYLHELNQNEKGAIYNCTGSEIDMVGYENYSMSVECYDYIYRKDEQLQIAGGKFNPIRNHISYFKKHYNYVVSPYTADDYNDCVRLFNGWKENKQNSTNLAEEHASELFSNLCLLSDMFGITVKIDDRIVGFSIGGMLSETEAICILRKADREYKGLS